MDNQPTSVLKATVNANYKNYSRPWCDESQRYALPVKHTELMPPVLYRTANGLPILSTVLKDMLGVTIATLTSSFSWNVSTHGSGELLYPTISIPLSLAAHIGKLCYLQITDGVTTWQTEVMKIYDQSELSWNAGSEKCGWVKFTFTTTCKVGMLPQGLTQFVYFPTFIGEPEHDVLIIADKDGNEVDNIYFGKVEKVMKMTVVVPEYLIDALSILPIISNPLLGIVSITDQWNNQISAKRITFKTEWLKGGCLAKMEFSFRNEIITAKPCCDENNPLGECLAADFTAKAILPNGGSEYSGGYYTTGLGNIDFEVGDLAVSYNNAIDWVDGPYRLIEWNGSGWTVLTVGNQFENCFCDRESKWIYKFDTGNKWADRPIITSSAVVGGQRILKGLSFKGSLVRANGLLVSNGCNYSNLGTITTQPNFFTTGIAMQSDTYDIKVCAIAGNCGELKCSVAILTEAPC